MVKVIGIPLYDRSIPDAVSECIQIIKNGEARLSRCVSATGAHGMVFAQKNPDFKVLLNNFFWNLPDGMPGVWVGRMKGAKNMQRCYGPDFFAALIKESASESINHFFCGGKDGVANELKDSCARNFGNHKVVGVYCPPFREMTESEWQTLANDIEKSGSDVVWIGISTPKQERFAYQLRKFVKVHFIITVGAAFDFHTGRLQKAPSWMQRSGLEWLFRLMVEPKRLYKRYLEIVPLFLLYNLMEFVNFAPRNKAEKP